MAGPVKSVADAEVDAEVDGGEGWRMETGAGNPLATGVFCYSLAFALPMYDKDPSNTRKDLSYYYFTRILHDFALPIYDNIRPGGVKPLLIKKGLLEKD